MARKVSKVLDPIFHKFSSLLRRANNSISFSGDTRVELITAIAGCGRETERARQALVKWIKRQQSNGRSIDEILTELQEIESMFPPADVSLHNAFRAAKAATYLPIPPDPDHLSPSSLRKSRGRMPESVISASSAGPSSGSFLSHTRYVDSPLPVSTSTSSVRRSEGPIPECVASPSSPGPSSVSFVSGDARDLDSPLRPTTPISPVRMSRDPSRMSDMPPESPTARRRRST